MTTHRLLGRSETELLWYQRRGFLAAAAAWTATGGFSAAQAQQRGNIVELVGDAQVNGARMTPLQVIQSGDEVVTGPGSSLVFVIGGSAFRVRQNSRMEVGRGATLSTVTLLRLVTGAVVSVWRQGPQRTITMPTLTAGIRGTGVYAEVMPDQDGRSYFCNCYGTVDIQAGGEFVLSQADYHQSFWGETTAREGRYLRPAPAINHGDEELEALARLTGQITTWEALGRKGVKDGRGYMSAAPGYIHPALMPR